MDVYKGEGGIDPLLADMSRGIDLVILETVCRTLDIGCTALRLRRV